MRFKVEFGDMNPDHCSSRLSIPFVEQADLGTSTSSSSPFASPLHWILTWSSLGLEDYAENRTTKSILPKSQPLEYPGFIIIDKQNDLPRSSQRTSGSRPKHSSDTLSKVSDSCHATLATSRNVPSPQAQTRLVCSFPPGSPWHQHPSLPPWNGSNRSHNFRLPIHCYSNVSTSRGAEWNREHRCWWHMATAFVAYRLQ